VGVNLSFKMELKNEFYIIIGLLAISGLATQYSQLQPLRVMLSIPLLLVLPGYSFMAALFPGRHDITGLERAAFSIGFSIVITPLIGLALNYSPWGINLITILISIITFTMFMSAVALVRRIRLADDQRFKLLIQFSYPKTLPSIALALAVMFSIGITVYVAANPGVGEKFTEFYMLDKQGGTSDYPFVVRAGRETQVILGIVNHENEETKYCVEMRTEKGKKLIVSCTLDNGEKYEKYVTISNELPNKKSKLEFWLYKNGEAQPYRKLHLWVDVI